MNFKIFIINFFIFLQIPTIEMVIAEKCSITKINLFYNPEANENFYKQKIGLRCDIKNSDDFTLDLENLKKIAINIKKYQQRKKKILNYVELNWPKDITKSSSLTRQFNISAFMNLFQYFSHPAWIHIHNLHSIELDLFEKSFHSIEEFVLINSHLRFKIDGKPVKTCSDITSVSNGTFNISSLFQIPLVAYQQAFFIVKCHFPLTLCPLIFNRTSIFQLKILNLANTFYRKNLMKFSNETFDHFDSNIRSLMLFQCEGIDLDTVFLNPFVFKNLQAIFVTCSLSSISIDLFASMKSLNQMYFETVHFQRVIRRNGIEWIKGINRGLHVNLSNLSDFMENSEANKYLTINNEDGSFKMSISEIFPEKDFCIFKDYPFDQLVFTFQYSREFRYDKDFEFLKKINPTYTCTYLWINRYFHLNELIPGINESLEMDYWFLLKNSNSYKNMNKNCDFQRRLSLCNRSDFHLKDYWGTFDYFILTKKLQIAVKILTYLVSLFSIITNSIIIRIIFAKHNNSVFKDFKHYTYLGLISVFSLCISLIEILSCLSECFYPFEVFCLGFHKTVLAQLFKMVFKESIVIALRFLSNFCYIAFAFCRISLIGRNKNKLVKFMSELTIWKYLLISIILSVSFSWIKYFKYSINFGHEELNYPIWNERDISTHYVVLPPILDFYMVFNVISDLFNYLVFVIVCFLVDLSMLVRLRSTVNESIERIKKMASNVRQMEKKKGELEDTMKKSIRMVVVNTSIGLLFKLPLVFLPLVNAIANFYYKKDKRYNNLSFDRFYTKLFDIDVFLLIQDLTELLYLLSVGIQYFVYKKFDKKFKEATISRPLSEKKFKKIDIID